MEIKTIQAKQDLIELELNNLTVAELLRERLWEDPATELAVWRREHPTKPPRLVLRTKGKSAVKVLLETIERIKKENEKLLKEFKSALK